MPIKVAPTVVPIDQVSDFTVMLGSRVGAAANFKVDGKQGWPWETTTAIVYYFENVGRNRKPRFVGGVKLDDLG